MLCAVPMRTSDALARPNIPRKITMNVAIDRLAIRCAIQGGLRRKALDIDDLSAIQLPRDGPRATGASLSLAASLISPCDDPLPENFILSHKQW